MSDPLGRDRHTGQATPAQMRAGRRWASRFTRYPATTDPQREADFESAEARNETERNRNK